jgi:valyl-tRNA synthetase
MVFDGLLPRNAVRSVDVSAPSATATAVANRPSLEAKLDRALRELALAQSKLDNDGFLSKAPAHLVEAEREKADRYAAEASELRRRLEEL